MTKEEKIKEAWGEKFDSDVDLYKGSKIVGFNYSYNSEEYNSIKYLDCIEIRPKSLKGIEDNNGWIKIESEDDLPKDYVECWFVSIYNTTIRIGFYSKSDNKFFSGEYYEIKEVTHYQLIEKPKPPIY